MAIQMYKVFFKDRIVFLENDFRIAVQAHKGLFFKYADQEELREMIRAFESGLNIKELHIFHEDPLVLNEDFSSCFRIIHAAGGLVYNSKGEFLAIKRNGIWDLPKGKAEKMEDPVQTAIREVTEECGLKSLIPGKSLIKTYHTYKLNNVSVLKETGWFEMRTSGSEKTSPQVKEDITETRWFRKSEVAVILENTFPSIVDVLRSSGLV
jgi:8-oxo-dGTP pyrophosphatase MutT (NUDIX family)